MSTVDRPNAQDAPRRRAVRGRWLTQTRVAAVCEQLGEDVSVRNVQRVLGGSLRDLAPKVRAWREAHLAPATATDPPEAEQRGALAALVAVDLDAIEERAEERHAQLLQAIRGTGRRTGEGDASPTDDAQLLKRFERMEGRLDQLVKTSTTKVLEGLRALSDAHQATYRQLQGLLAAIERVPTATTLEPVLTALQALDTAQQRTLNDVLDGLRQAKTPAAAIDELAAAIADLTAQVAQLQQRIPAPKPTPKRRLRKKAVPAARRNKPVRPARSRPVASTKKAAPAKKAASARKAPQARQPTKAASPRSSARRKIAPPLLRKKTPASQKAVLQRKPKLARKPTKVVAPHKPARSKAVPSARGKQKTVAKKEVVASKPKAARKPTQPAPASKQRVTARSRVRAASAALTATPSGLRKKAPVAKRAGVARKPKPVRTLTATRKPKTRLTSVKRVGTDRAVRKASRTTAAKHLKRKAAPLRRPATKAAAPTKRKVPSPSKPRPKKATPRRAPRRSS